MSLMDKLKTNAVPAAEALNKVDTNTNQGASNNVIVNDPTETEKTYTYAVLGLESLTLSLSGGDVKSLLGRIILDQDQHDELQKLIKKGRPDINMHLRLVDLSEAERIAKEHMALQKTQAHRGAASSTANAHTLTQSIAKDEARNLDVVEEPILNPGVGELKIPE